MALKDFLAVINRVDVARSSRFVVEIQPPNIPGLGIKPQQQINLMCQDVTFPGQNIRTSTDDLRQGPTREIGQAVTYGSTNMTFICTPGLPEKLFFEAWQGLMFNRITWQAKYYKSYIGQIKLRQLDRTDMVRYGVILYEAYPKIINAQDYSNTAADTMQTLQVEFNFHHWAMDEEVYDGVKRYGSEGGSDQEKPKRTVMAGTENMSVAEAQAFIRGETRNTLGQTYGEALSAAGGDTGAGALAAKMLTGAGKNMGFLGFKDSWAQLPATGKNKQGKVVAGTQHPKSRNQQKTAAVETKRVAKKRSRVPPAKRGYMQTVQTTPEQTLKELKSVVRAATWIDPNTRKSVSTSKRSVSAGGVNFSATISLGGSRGGGLGNLIAARGLSSRLSSGISIPRFGGIPAIRGAGFQVRAVGYRRPSGGRANHNAEGEPEAGGER